MQSKPAFRPASGGLVAVAAVLVAVGCGSPFAVDKSGAISDATPLYGGGGTTPSGQRPPGLDTLPAPAAPAGSVSNARVALWTLADSTGSATITLGAVTLAGVPNVNCFTSQDPAVSPWGIVPEGVILPSPFCVRQVVGDSSYVVYRGLGRKAYAAAVARF